MESLRAKGGTMALWKASLDPYVTVLPCTSPAVLPLLLSILGLSRSLHIGIYLPTGSLEQDWIIALAALTLVLEDAHKQFPGVPVYVRGDSNVNPNRQHRLKAWNDLLTRFHLRSHDLGHPTYHHIVGQGTMDSQLDVLVSPSSAPAQLVEIICAKSCDIVKSSHDVILSSFSLSPILTSIS